MTFHAGRILFCGMVAGILCAASAETQEQMVPVRPGNPVLGVPFWTRYATTFRRPPNFDFAYVPGASNYTYTVIDAKHARHAFTTNIPFATLAPVWAKLPPGAVTVLCEGKDAAGRPCGTAGLKRFAKTANFTGDYPKPPRTYGEAIAKAYGYIASLTNRTPLYLAYPSKMRAAMVEAMVKYAAREPADGARALAIARAEADALIATRAPKGSPLENFTLTYAAEPVAGEPKEAGKFRGQSMNSYPAGAGQAFLALYGATRDRAYLGAARDIAETYLRRQLANGTWYLRERLSDGERVSDNLLVPNAVIAFLLKLHRTTGDRRYLDSADRAFAYIERGPLATFDWEGQFEDVNPASAYRNLSIHMSADTALHLLARFPGDTRRISQAREILRFVEDQFVHWEAPPRAWANDIAARRYPAAFEQYYCYTPIDSSAAKAIRLYAAMYRAEGRQLDLAKARALADSIVAVQDEDGRIPTWWEKDVVEHRGADWLNCMVEAVSALEVADSLRLNLIPWPADVKIPGGSAPAHSAIRRETDAAIPSEGYALTVGADGVKIVSSDAAGAFYAEKTLAQLRRADGTYPCVKISDHPAYRWRGYLLDCSRHFMDVSTVKQVLEWMADYKFNVFHWHLVDDQGWRVPFAKYPRLNTVGATRPRPDWVGAKHVYDDATGAYGPFGYTEADIREIRAYAAARHIRIMPEMEIPGHSREVVAAYPELYCENADPKAFTNMNNIGLCLGNNATIRFFKDALDRFCELFPEAEVIHIGGDECPRENWKKCPKCQRRMRELGLRSEDELQAWCTRVMTEHLASKGRKAIGWNEIVDGGLASNTLVMCWNENGRKAANLAIRQGNPVVMTPYEKCYYNMPKAGPRAYLPLRERDLRWAYHFDPCLKLDAKGSALVLGGECCTWTERVIDRKDVEWALFPRFFACAEALWTLPASKPGLTDFIPRAEAHDSRLRARGCNVCPVSGAAQVTRTASLPNVLILGDSISLGYTSAVKRMLAGRAMVSRPACNCGPSKFYLKDMEDWVGEDRWDVIHVNFGIWDNHYLKGAENGLDLYWGASATNALSPIAHGTAIRDLGFRIRTPAPVYCRNLRTILSFLKTRSNKVIFALSTPLQAWEKDDRCGRLRVYNELAADICAEMGVAVNDLYSVAERNLDCQTDGCHYNSKGSRALAEAVVKSIEQTLGL